MILLLLYRYYKSMYGEWSSWHFMFAAWNVGTLLAASVGTAQFWEYRFKPAGHFLLYLYYTGVLSTALYTFWCGGVWLMLGSRLSEGWWSRLSRYCTQMWAMGLMQSCAARQTEDYIHWWRRQLEPSLVLWCGRLQAANTCVLFACGTFLLLLCACGVFDTISYEGW
jgi:hypothetical protein